MGKTQAIYYRDRRGREPVNEFIEGLDPKPAAKVDDFVEEHLNGREASAPPPEHPFSSQVQGEMREHLQDPSEGGRFRCALIAAHA